MGRGPRRCRTPGKPPVTSPSRRSPPAPLARPAPARGCAISSPPVSPSSKRSTPFRALWQSTVRIGHRDHHSRAGRVGRWSVFRGRWCSAAARGQHPTGRRSTVTAAAGRPRASPGVAGRDRGHGGVLPIQGRRAGLWSVDRGAAADRQRAGLRHPSVSAPAWVSAAPGRVEWDRGGDRRVDGGDHCGRAAGGQPAALAGALGEALGALAVLTAGALLAARRVRGAARASLYALAAVATLAAQSSLLAATVALFKQGIVTALSTGQPYAMGV